MELSLYGMERYHPVGRNHVYATESLLVVANSFLEVAVFKALPRIVYNLILLDKGISVRLRSVAEDVCVCNYCLSYANLLESLLNLVNEVLAFTKNPFFIRVEWYVVVVYVITYPGASFPLETNIIVLIWAYWN